MSLFEFVKLVISPYLLVRDGINLKKGKRGC
jgi:hypothetical protein